MVRGHLVKHEIVGKYIVSYYATSQYDPKISLAGSLEYLLEGLINMNAPLGMFEEIRDLGAELDIFVDMVY